MKTAAIFYLVALTACGHAPLSPTASTTTLVEVAPKVVLISIDGLRADALSQAQAPEIRKLMARGVYTLRGRTVLPATTLPAHTSMLTGLTPAEHLVLWDDYRPEYGTIGKPTVFTIAHAAGKRTVAVVGKEKFRTLNVAGSIDRFAVVAGDAEIANQAIIEAGVGFDLLFVHLPDVDIAGHAQSWLSPTYMAAVEAADAAVGRIVAALPPNTTVIVTADHGGRGKTHGADTPEDTTVPWVAAGAGPRGELAAQVNGVDTAATVLAVLGLRLPDGSSAKAVQEAVPASP